MQVTLRLNETGKAELERLKSRLGFKKNAPTLEHLLLVYRSLMDESWQRGQRIEELEEQVRQLQAIISYLEAKG